MIFHCQARAQQMHQELEDTLHRDCWIVAGEGEFSDLPHCRRDAADAGVFGKSFLGKWKKSPLLPSGRKMLWKNNTQMERFWKLFELAGQGDYAALQVVMQEYWDFHREEEKFLALFQISLYQHTP